MSSEKQSPSNYIVVITIACLTIAVCLISVLIFLDRKYTREKTSSNSQPLSEIAKDASATDIASVESEQDTIKRVARPFITITTLKPSSDLEIGCRVLRGYDCELWGTIETTRESVRIRASNQATNNDDLDPETFGLGWVLGVEELGKYFEIYTVSLSDGSIVAESSHTSANP